MERQDKDLGKAIFQYLQYHCYADDIRLYCSLDLSQDNSLVSLITLEACINETKTWVNKLNSL